jgi:Sialidase, N-terminal domain
LATLEQATAYSGLAMSFADIGVQNAAESMTVAELEQNKALIDGWETAYDIVTIVDGLVNAPNLLKGFAKGTYVVAKGASSAIKTSSNFIGKRKALLRLIRIQSKGTLLSGVSVLKWKSSINSISTYIKNSAKAITKVGSNIFGVAKSNVVDVVAHFVNGKYQIYVDGVLSEVTEAQLTKFIKDLSPGKTIRLLSCSDLTAATNIAKAAERDIIASNDAVKLFSDGTIETGQLYKIDKNGGKVAVENTTKPTAKTVKTEYVLLGKQFLSDGSELVDFPKKMLFGQHRISPSFSSTDGVPEALAGRSVVDVAADIKSNKISTDVFLIRYTELPDGRLVTLNNRGLAALTIAGKNPSHAVFVPYKDAAKSLLSDVDKVHPILKNEGGTNIIYITEQRSGLNKLQTIIRNE